MSRRQASIPGGAMGGQHPSIRTTVIFVQGSVGAPPVPCRVTSNKPPLRKDSAFHKVGKCSQKPSGTTDLPLASSFLCRQERVHAEHTGQTRESLEKLWGIFMTSLAAGQRWPDHVLVHRTQGSLWCMTGQLWDIIASTAAALYHRLSRSWLMPLFQSGAGPDVVGSQNPAPLRLHIWIIWIISADYAVNYLINYTMFLIKIKIRYFIH